MSIPVISVDIGPDKVIFNADSEGYQTFAHDIMDRAKNALANRQTAMTMIVQLEDIWRKTEKFFADTVLQDPLNSSKIADITGNINRIRVNINDFFVFHV